MQQEDLLKDLTADIKSFQHILWTAADTILDEGVSFYPVFVLHRQEVELGITLIDKDRSNTPWSVQASTLEEFVTKQLIDPTRLSEFRKIYKDPRKFLCLFVLETGLAQFVFVPR